MFALKKILVPIDFSDRSYGAIHYAQALARHFGAEVTLLHVLLPIQYEIGTMEFAGGPMLDVMTNRAEQLTERLEGFAVEELQGLTVHRLLEEGDPAHRIVALAHDQQFDLVVLPTHGYGPFRRFILGSVTAKVLHDADCPIWTGVHMEEVARGAPVEIKTVLCALDLGDQSLKVLTWAARLASSYQARLVLVHAIPSLESRPGEYFDPEWRAHLTALARADLEKLQQEAGVEAEICVVSGDPVKVVRDSATEKGADVLVIGRGSAAGIFGRLRTNSYAIIRESPCPVVSV